MAAMMIAVVKRSLMFSFIITRLVRQVFDGMSAAHAAQVMHERPMAVLKAYLRECGVMDGDTFVDEGLEALCWLKQGRDEAVRQWVDACAKDKDVVLAVALGRVKMTKEEAKWAMKVLEWAEAKRRGKTHWDKWMKKQKMDEGLSEGKRRLVEGV